MPSDEPFHSPAIYMYFQYDFYIDSVRIHSLWLGRESLWQALRLLKTTFCYVYMYMKF